MQSKSLKDALAEAEAEAPALRTGTHWEGGEYDVEIINSNVNREFGAPRIGIQVQNESGRRRWFDLYFDPTNAKGYAATGRKLKALGLNDIIDALAEQFPVIDGASDAANESAEAAQLDALAVAMRGIKFKAKIDQVESNKNEPGSVDEGSEDHKKNPAAPIKKYINYLDVRALLAGPVAPAAAPASSFSGFGGGVMGN